jgi:uncharacterized protein (TIGR00159 family)
MHADWLRVILRRAPLELLRDVVDITVVAYAIYRILLLVRGTRAAQVGQGLLLIAVVYAISQRLELITTFTLLDRSLTSFLVFVVVIFQADIRRALMRVGDRPFFLRWRKPVDAPAVEEVIAAAEGLAQRRIGALFVFERDASVDDFVSQCTIIDAELSTALLFTVFLPSVAAAGAVLPLTSNGALDRQLGTRHRAALGISEETDAAVVVVSEERGEISLCFNGNIVRGLDAQTARQALYGVLYSKRQAAALLREAVQPAREGRKSLRPPPPPPPRSGVRPVPKDAPEAAPRASGDDR